jgi:hypothetical protein
MRRRVAKELKIGVEEKRSREAEKIFFFPLPSSLFLLPSSLFLLPSFRNVVNSA